MRCFEAYLQYQNRPLLDRASGTPLYRVESRTRDKRGFGAMWIGRKRTARRGGYAIRGRTVAYARDFTALFTLSTFLPDAVFAVYRFPTASAVIAIGIFSRRPKSTRKTRQRVISVVNRGSSEVFSLFTAFRGTSYTLSTRYRSKRLTCQSIRRNVFVSV